MGTKAAAKKNLSAKTRLTLPSWHGWAANKREKFKALDHHGCLACSGRVDLLPEIAILILVRKPALLVILSAAFEWFA